MVSRVQHLRSLRQRLNAMLVAGDSRPSEFAAGLSQEAAVNLNWLQQDPRISDDPRARALTLGFADDCAGHHLPTALVSPVDGTLIPVKSVRGGYAGESHISIDVENEARQTQPRNIGKLAAILRANDNPTRLFALTAGHVIGAFPGAAKGDAVTLTTPSGDLLLSRYFDCQPNFGAPLGSTRIDAGLMQIEASEVEPLQSHSDFWATSWVPPFAQERMRLRTRGSEFTGSGAQYLSCRMAVNTGTTFTYLVNDALCWTAQTGFMGGDSGAPIWSDNDELVAIHMGTTPPGSVPNVAAIPIGRILRWANADLVARGEALIRRAVPRTGESLPGAPVPAGAPAPQLPTAAGDVDVLARTMWGEARGEPDPDLGMSAIAHVVFNRIARNTYFGKDIVSVCRKPFQFSCWNPNDPNLPQLNAVTQDNARFKLALQIAATLKTLPNAQRGAQDRTVGATHYHTRQLQPPPRWARGHTPCASLGNHLFYRDIA